HGTYVPTEEQKGTLDFEYRDVFLSIEDAMAVTKEMDSSAIIPYIVPMLCQKVKELDGFRTEGIFRKSASILDVKKLRNKERIETETAHTYIHSYIYFSFDDQNVHIFANCLKEWLRSIEDPLIPELYYDFCVEMAKQRKLDKGQFEVFFSQLPAVNRETLKYLVNFLRELIQPQNVEVTLMGLDNLATIFGPTLLRCEALVSFSLQKFLFDSTKDNNKQNFVWKNKQDPTTALANVPSEKQFVIALIEKS
ncbi:RhoGAP domain-containing protein, partial [Reticulomyxa filosa]